jgi:NitT/TauT family transport system substrate-binding protein
LNINRFIKYLFILLSLSMLSSCLAKNENSKQRNSLNSVILRLQWHVQAQFAGYYVALDKGFYNEEGLDVKIEEGGYGRNALLNVSEGVEEFGVKYMSDLVSSGDSSLLSLANILKDSGLLLISKKEKGIQSLADFPGHSISFWFIGNEYQYFSLPTAE